MLPALNHALLYTAPCYRTLLNTRYSRPFYLPPEPLSSIVQIVLLFSGIPAERNRYNFEPNRVYVTLCKTLK